MTPGIRVGVDIGGTFTDVVVRRPGDADADHEDPEHAQGPQHRRAAGARAHGNRLGLPPQQIARFVHGTTVATNAVLERKGARVGLITTEGFRDVLEIGRQMRHQMYDLALDPETPTFLAPGRFRREVPSASAATGEVLHALDEAAVAAAADELVAAGARRSRSCSCSRFSTTRTSAAPARSSLARHPDVFVSLSCEVDPAFREYERTVVTTFDAYVKPVVDRYLANLEAGLAAARVPAPLQIMQSRGGISGSATARLRPVRLFLSGPAAGVIGARMVGEAAGCRRPHHRRYRRHLVRHRADRGRHAGAAIGGPDRRLSGAHQHGRRQLDRLRRRLDRLARRREAAAGRAAFGRLRARACLLRPRRQASRP